MKTSLSILFLSILFVGCEESPVILPDFEVPITDRVVLIEDFTGVQCPNCPKGTSAIQSAMAALPGKVVSVAIHGDLLTDPIPNESKYDFRTPDAKKLELYFAPYAKPAANIDRIKYAGEDDLFSTSPEFWLSHVEESLNRELQLNIVIEKLYDPNSRILTIKPSILPIEDLDGDFIFTIYVTESKIIDAQESGTEIIPDYEHNHVLRHMMTNFSGNPISANLVKAVSVNLGTFTYTIPSSPVEFHPEHMEVVVSVARNSSSDKSVVQNAFVHVIE